MRAGFAAVDISPPVGTHKIGWLKVVVSTEIMDPVYARIAVFESRGTQVALVQLDTLSIRWTTVNEIRQQVGEAYGFPGANILVAATHNHSGPAVANCGDVKRDQSYVATMVARIVAGFGAALDGLADAEVGFQHVFEFGLSHNRRTVLRDGRALCHGGGFNCPDALYVEGPIDPEVGVLAVRGAGGELLGVVTTFACHPVHHGATGAVTAGFPGAFASEMRRRGCPATVFLNGASGNISPGNPLVGLNPGMQEIGAKLADDVWRALEEMEYRADLPLAAESATVQLPYRRYTDDEVTGTIRGAQRFVDPSVYDRGMPNLLERIRNRGSQPAEVQGVAVGDVVYVGIPAEYFVQHALRIKEKSFPKHAIVVGHANGMVGYVPTQEAFRRGGYETTFAGSSRMAPEAGDLLADAAIELVGNMSLEEDSAHSARCLTHG